MAPGWGGCVDMGPARVSAGGLAARDSMDVPGSRGAKSLSEKSTSDASSLPDIPEDSICEDFLRCVNLGNDELVGSGELDRTPSLSPNAE